ncbi:MAG: hypothetical protein JRH20_14890 [Deltaproteobacteria bacterium]|nr:hypothetical protein [Deltaproteobacteria bacterium]
MLNIFPERALDSSIHTSIFIGILVMWVGTELLGWAFAGFVVPGYLAALAIVQPMAVFTTTLEAVLTFGLVWGVGKGASWLRIWSSAFGRERFLLFLMFSIPVRLVVEGVCSEQLQQMTAYLFGGATWTDVPFHSVGLVLVPLLANAFWWPGLARGALQVSVVTSVTYAVVTHVLMRYTNLHLAHLELVFESLALEFGSVPKVHIVLLTAAVVAARNNVKYGWDFNGILVPSLLAVIVTVPSKFFVTLLEVMILSYVYRGIVRLPGISGLNLEGPRQLVTMYLLSFGFKWVLSSVAEALHLNFMVSDVFGFGYLLTSLVAVKCVTKRDYFKTILPVAYTAVVGFVAGALITMALTIGSIFVLGGGAGIVSSSATTKSVSLERAVLGAYASVRRSPPASFRHNPRETRAVFSALRLLAGGGEEALKVARRELQRRGMHVQWSTRADGQRCLAAKVPRLTPAEPSGAPSLFLCGGPGPILLVPRPLSDPRALIAAAYVAHRIDVAAVVVLGFDLARDDLSPKELNRHALAQALGFRRAASAHSVLVVLSAAKGQTMVEPRSSTGQLPLRSLRRVLPNLGVRFHADHGPLQALWTLLLSKDGLLTVSMDHWASRFALEEAYRVKKRGASKRLLEHAFCSNRPWGLREQVGLGRGAAPQSFADAMSFGEFLIGEVMRWVPRGKGEPPASARYLARNLDVGLTKVLDARKRPLWLLDGGPSRGVWVFRPGSHGNWVYAASHAPSHRETAPTACTLFDQLNAPVLWISASPCPGPVRFPRVADEPAGRVSSIAEAFAEAFAIREALRPRRDEPRWEHPRRMLFVTRLVDEELLEYGAIAAVDHELLEKSERVALLQELGELHNIWPFVSPYGGQKADMPLVARTCFPLRYANALAPRHGVALWLAPQLLREADGHTSKQQRFALYAEVGVKVVSPQVAEELLGGVHSGPKVDGDNVLALMRRHLVNGLRGPLEVLKAHPSAQLLAVDKRLRVELLYLGPKKICRASSGPPSPQNSCWSRSPTVGAR